MDFFQEIKEKLDEIRNSGFKKREGVYTITNKKITL